MDDERAALRERIEGGCQRVLTAVEGIEPTVLENQPAVGSWSARDVVGHLADWQSEMLDAAEHILGGPKPRFQPIKNTQGFNSMRAALWGVEPWEAAQSDFEQSCARMSAFLERITPEQLEAIGPYPSGEIGRLRKLLGRAAEHLEEHAGQLEQWRLLRTGVREPRRGRW
jgi:hypothetical protein